MNVVRIDQLEMPELSTKTVANLIIVMQQLDRDATHGLAEAVEELQSKFYYLEQMVLRDRRKRAERKSWFTRLWHRHA